MGQVELVDDEAIVEQARAASRRLDGVLDRLRDGARLDPMLLREVVNTINASVLEAAEAYRGMLERQWRDAGPAAACSLACWAGELRCPGSEPLAPVTDELRAAGFEPYSDAVEEHLAHKTRCICGEAMDYVGLQRGREIKAWTLCAACGHWLPL